ncbi:MAG: hypothetical protein K6E33_06150 [Lachnospiraceae bacterium]|nr:hypothetical protein [Lachnospiraceae bacterium]
MRAYLVWVELKRTFSDPYFYLSAALSMLVMALLRYSLFPSVDNRIIGLCTDSGNEGAAEVCELLETRAEGGLQYVRYDSLDDLKNAVITGECDSGFNLTGLPERVEILISRSSNKYELAKEGIYSAVFYRIAGEMSGDPERYREWLSSDALFNVVIESAEDDGAYGSGTEGIGRDGSYGSGAEGIGRGGNGPLYSGYGTEGRGMASVFPVIGGIALLSCAYRYEKECQRIREKAGCAAAGVMVFVRALTRSLPLLLPASLIFMQGEVRQVLLLAAGVVLVSVLGAVISTVLKSAVAYMGFVYAFAMGFGAVYFLRIL